MVPYRLGDVVTINKEEYKVDRLSLSVKGTMLMTVAKGDNRTTYDWDGKTWATTVCCTQPKQVTIEGKSLADGVAAWLVPGVSVQIDSGGILIACGTVRVCCIGNNGIIVACVRGADGDVYVKYDVATSQWLDG